MVLCWFAGILVVAARIELGSSETWPLKQQIISRLQAFENRVLRKIFGPIFDIELNIWRRRKNAELRSLYNKPIISNIIRAKILQWAGHVARAEEASNIKRTLNLQYSTCWTPKKHMGRWCQGISRIHWNPTRLADHRPGQTRMEKAGGGGQGPSRSVKTLE
ncbi:hypothetical protein M8J77_019719 [Diaphorina citri]|nr:hypothetical protein M8J77_019719 [Diaphorina citri]